MIDRLRLTAAAKIHLVTLKKRTGLPHYNGICRHALCISLANPSSIPEESYDFQGGVDIEWKTFTGSYDDLYRDLIVSRLKSDGLEVNPDNMKHTLIQHVHRGLSYLVSKKDPDLLLGISQKLSRVSSKSLG